LYLGLLVLYPAVYYVTYPLTRQRYAIEPVLAILAAFTFAEVFSLLAPKIGFAPFQQHPGATAKLGWTVVALLLIVCGGIGVYRAATRQVLVFAPRPVLSAQRFIDTCGLPNQEASFNNVIELDYQRAKLRVRIIDNTFGWVFDRQTGALLMPAQSLGCWKKANP
jgi:hypothetical protein